MSDLLNIQPVIAAARAGGAVLLEYFGQALVTETKSNLGDLKTKADVESEQAVIAVLEAAFPDYSIYAEESGLHDKQSEYQFVIDPLDGTNNFVLGLSNFTVSIGLFKGDEIMLGVIYCPVLNQMYSAVKGQGAYMNGTRLYVSTETDLQNSTISYTCGYNTEKAYSRRVVQYLQDHSVKRVLDSWAPAYDYCLLASGRIEAVISREGDLEDYVAAKLLVAEAGGLVVGFDGKRVNGRAADFIAVNNREVLDRVLVPLKAT